LSGIPRFEMSGRPARVAIGPAAKVASFTTPERTLFSTDIETFA